VGDWLATGAHSLPLAFERGRSEPRITDEAALGAIVTALGRRTTCKLTLVGHACGDGDERVNEYLGRERARAARALLLARGARPGLLGTASAGTRHVLADQTSEEEHARDRRVVLEAVCP
jgi:outer membrane protein OmpA-like peptidoglycan-associated protein